MNRIIIFLIGISFLSSALQAGEPFRWGNERVVFYRMSMKEQVTENLQQENSVQPQAPDQRSVSKAVLFSLLIPGSGEFYSKSYIKAGLFFLVEVGAWALNVTYTKKGDQKDTEFKRFAETHWSEYRYWSWVNYKAANSTYYEPGDLFPYEEQTAPAGGKWYLIPEDYFNQHKDEIIRTLREIEGDGRLGFTHRLPTTRTQQYYEMIGKYPAQFGAGWDDASFREYNPLVGDITPHNDHYMDMREDSNRMYQIAGYGAMTVLVNHLISALDAGFTARNYNRKHSVRMEMSYKNILYKQEYVNMFGVNMSW